MAFSAHRDVSSELHFRLQVCWAATFLSRGVHCVMVGKTSSVRETGTVVAVQFTERLDAEGFPQDEAWNSALPIRFHQDWQGKNDDLLRETEARLLWTRDTLYLRFLARYRSITVFDDAEPDGRRDQLWNRDVAEIFLQPAGSDPRCYKEFEVSPNGFWIDLDIGPGKKQDLKSGLKRRANVDHKNKLWKAELALPVTSLTARFDPAEVWRVNFYRVEGPKEPRFYSAWRPTGTPAPNFHVPESFGELLFKS
jgi:alpha-galactosidase